MAYSLPPYRQDAIADAGLMQSELEQQDGNTDKRLQNYQLAELIGKGSFGRVYKAVDRATGGFVAVKVINIEDGDRQDQHADTLNDIRKEISTLRALSGSGATNINTIIDDFLVGSFICVVTEFCAGGSVSTLMKPTGSVPEKWIIPILREVSEGLAWVHDQGIVHRDIKCANVLIHDDGRVQLCDFGVAGIVETRYDKRNTFIGTLHWMAPEMFDPDIEYGKEVDIWAFGSLAFEAATGLPPNARLRDISRLGSHLRQNAPRLDGDQYSAGLKDFVACCLTEDWSKRPSIGDIRRHPLISGTAAKWPTSSLAEFVQDFKRWESQGGSRTSLFSGGGAQRQQPPLESSSPPDDWDFTNWPGTIIQPPPIAAPPVATDASIGGLLTRRRHNLPPHSRSVTAPLEKLFDSHTLTGYGEYARDYYQGLPLRSDPGPNDAVRESLIDLDEAWATIKPKPETRLNAMGAGARRQTLEWKFPQAIPPDPELIEAPSTPSFEISHSSIDPGHFMIDKRQSVLSLIDLDDCVPLDISEGRPRTATSESGSTISDRESFPFEQTLMASSQMREPSIYVEDHASSTHGHQVHNDATAGEWAQKQADELEIAMPDRPCYHVDAADPSVFLSSSYELPPLPEAPSSWVLEGHASDEDMKAEMRRMLLSLNQHLDAIKRCTAS